MACRILILAAAVCLGLQTACLAQESLLLSGNGATNAANSEYGDAKLSHVGGSYEASPATEEAKDGQSVPFSEGVLTNGDSSFNHKREPMPYTYWQKTAQGELIVNLARRCHIDRIRVCLLSPDTGPHGTQAVQVYLTGDPLEFPDVLKVGTIAPAVNGWNEFSVNRDADGLRLVFEAAAGKQYITVSEVELWGSVLEQQPAPEQAASAADPKRVEDGITWWAFDFGPAGSPSFARFCVADSKTVYSPERGFGWVPYEGGKPVTESNFGPASAQVPGLGDRDRGSGPDTLFRDFVMTSEYYHTQVRQTFAVDVPDGAYRILSMHGDT